MCSPQRHAWIVHKGDGHKSQCNSTSVIVARLGGRFLWTVSTHLRRPQWKLVANPVSRHHFWSPIRQARLRVCLPRWTREVIRRQCGNNGGGCTTAEAIRFKAEPHCQRRSNKPPERPTHNARARHSTIYSDTRTASLSAAAATNLC